MQHLGVLGWFRFDGFVIKLINIPIPIPIPCIWACFPPSGGRLQHLMIGCNRSASAQDLLIERQVIEGWDEDVTKMLLGEEETLRIPAGSALPCDARFEHVCWWQKWATARLGLGE